MKKDRLFTHIESGKFKGKKLLLPSLENTRSTKSIVKACVFDTLRYKLDEKIFVEVFGGSGVMALEALSNGALQVFILEKDVKAYEIACKNAKSVDNENAMVYKGDSFELLPNLCQSELLRKTPFIAYFDPPFHLRSGFNDIYERVFELINSLSSANLELFIIEHSSKMAMPSQINAFHQSKFKKFGNTSLSFYAKASI